MANAEAVDSAKTLLSDAANRDDPARGTGSRRDAPAGRGELGEASTGDTCIRVSDELPRGGEILLGRYRLVERLGAGGFGVVWHAHDEQLDRPVALKRIPLPSEEDRERATREALATARLSHPAIVALYEARADEDAFYLISELVRGDTLALLIVEDELSDEEVLEIGLALCEALEHAHARGVIHRDVKPHNVLVSYEQDTRTSSPVAKLADFGGATLAGDDALTRSGDVFGTLAYMAPEQSEGDEAGPPADLYSLGIVLYEALSGINPVRGRTPAATARRIGAPVEPLARRRRDLPRELTRALDNAMARDPDRRGTLAELHETLVSALERGLTRRLRTRARSARPAREIARQGSSSEHSREQLEPRPREEQARRADLTTPRPASHGAGAVAEFGPAERPARGVALPRSLWLGCVLAIALWQTAQGRIGVALLVVAAGAPLLLAPRRAGPGWLVAVLAPALGMAGLAGVFPALAGQRASWRARAALALLGFWWLALAEPLLARHLWLGPPAGLPPRAIWEASFDSTSKELVGPLFTFELLIGAAVWALAAAVLPWIVRGRRAALDVVMAVGWTVGLLAAVPLLERALLPHANDPSPRGALLGAVLGCAIAICARALRGPI
jgi:eukaryotic-like serine/threonine-protein kinase